MAKIIHHGIQRSGTNYLYECLSQLNQRPLYPDPAPERNNPRHKHFRWQKDKTSIPSCIFNQYSNTISASSIDEINKICNYNDVFHIVMKKDIKKWIISILNWGVHCNWFSEYNALTYSKELIKDYTEYYKFWDELALTSDKIIITSVQKIHNNFDGFLDVLNEHNVTIDRKQNFYGIIEEVLLSPVGRKNLFAHVDVDKILQS